MSDLNKILDELISRKVPADAVLRASLNERRQQAPIILERKKALRDKLATEEGEDLAEAEVERVLDEFTYSGVANVAEVAQHLKRGFFFDCLRDVTPFSKQPWGKTSVSALLKKAYIER